MAHVHAHPDSPLSRRATRRLAIVLGLSLLYAAAEVVGGLLSNSLALIADAGHMLADALALGLALFAAWSARRPPDPHRTYGYQRAEILAAMFNGVTLIVIALFVFLEAWERFRTPPDVDFRMMAPVAFGGLVVNLIAAKMLHGHQVGLNVRAAYLHVLGDLLGSIGALTAAGLIAAFGWNWADPLASALIAGIIVYSAIKLVLAAGNVLMEGAPSHLDSREVRQALEQLDGVCEVHDLHVWSLGGGVPLLSAHLVMDHTVTPSQLLRDATTLLEQRYDVTHVTLQIEPPDFNIVDRLSPDPDGGTVRSGRST